MDDIREEVEFDVALHLEAYTSETRDELFTRAMRALRAEGIRVKAGYAPSLDTDPEASRALSGVLYPEY